MGLKVYWPAPAERSEAHKLRVRAERAAYEWWVASVLAWGGLNITVFVLWHWLPITIMAVTTAITELACRVYARRLKALQ